MQQRTESLLTTIDLLGATKIRQLQQIHDLKSYSNATRIIRQLEPYTHSFFFEREKVIYLNKEGRQLIGSTKEVKRTPLLSHTLLRNDVYLYFNCPIDWQTERAIETREKALSRLDIQIRGVTAINKKKVVADAVFKRNGYLHIIEIDNTRNMTDNKKKIDAYMEILPQLERPILYFFTQSDQRKKRLEKWLAGRGKVFTFGEIR